MKVQGVKNFNYLPVYKNQISFKGNLVTRPDKFVKNPKTVVKTSALSFMESLKSLFCTGLSKKSDKHLEKIFVSNVVSKSTDNKISTEEFENLLTENNFKKNKKGGFKKKFSAKEFKDVMKPYGIRNYDYGLDLYEKMCQPLKQQEQENLKDFLEKGNNKEYSKNNFNKLFMMFSFLTKGKDYKEVKKVLDYNQKCVQVFQNYASNPPNPSSYDALKSYKGNGFAYINDELRSTEPSFALYRFFINNKIRNISSFIDTQVIKEPISLYRGENITYSLADVKTSDGKTINLAKKMFDAANSCENEEIDKLREFVLDNELSAIQPGFLSTSLSRNTASAFSFSAPRDKGCIFEFKTAPNTKGAFADISPGLDEYEVLLQKGSKIKINDMFYDHGTWIIQAEVSN
ncbi:hypothetical protein IJ732_00150 [bacterium]|nr:hypothetical protein [bacterium]